ncbi:hypothetical protein SAMN04489712_103449 [Thermomonospora echinospora]|uniref:Uncharacterized protein n=2 Tax=Thermomonospora echinospora TaxID=1992 RepID=A0A1H5XX72_9ACTN|nr:hypothetical protein SAMN04489712_103449 [Thermomonospora echinospora]
MRRRRDRDLYIDLLEEELGCRLPAKRDDRDVYDVLHLVKSCLAYPGAVRTLAMIVGRFHGGARAMQNLNELIEQLFPEPLLTSQERRELNRLLLHDPAGGGMRVADRTVIGDLYGRAVGPLGPPLNRDVDDLREVLALLEDATVGLDGVPPLLAFVENLAAHADEPIAGALRAWSERFARRLGLEPGTAHAIRGRVERAPRSIGPRSYLIIEFRPDAVDADRYLTSAWLQIDDAHGAMLRCDDEDPLPRTRFPRVIEELLTDPRVVNRPRPELIVEFVLPRSLLCVPLDQIRVDIEGLERRLGIEYPIVVRSFDRMRKPALHHNWRRKWNWLRDNPARAGMCRLPRHADFDEERLYNTLVSDESSVCLALAFIPRNEYESPPDELEVGLHAGVPIAVWCRWEREPGRFFAEVQELWGQGALELPESVLALRRKALRALDETAAENHLGFQLTLMFDDADRLPEPYVRLSAPA